MKNTSALAENFFANHSGGVFANGGEGFFADDFDADLLAVAFNDGIQFFHNVEDVHFGGKIFDEFHWERIDEAQLKVAGLVA